MYLEDVKYNAASVKHFSFSSCLLLIRLVYVHGAAGDLKRSLQNQESHIHKENLREDKSPLLKPSLWDFFFFNPGDIGISGKNQKSKAMINSSL